MIALGGLPALAWATTLSLGWLAPVDGAPGLSLPAILPQHEGLSELLARFTQITLLPVNSRVQVEIDPVGNRLTLTAPTAWLAQARERLGSSRVVAVVEQDHGSLHVWLTHARAEALVVEVAPGDSQLIVGQRREDSPLRLRWLGAQGCVASLAGAPTEQIDALCSPAGQRVVAHAPALPASMEALSRALRELAQLEERLAKPRDFERWRARRPADLIMRSWLAQALVHATRDELELALEALRALEAFEPSQALAQRLGQALLERALLSALEPSQRERLVAMAKRHGAWLKATTATGPAIALGLRRAGHPALSLPIYTSLLASAPVQAKLAQRRRMTAALATAAAEAGQRDRAFYVALYLRESDPELTLEATWLRELGQGPSPSSAASARRAQAAGVLEQRLSRELPLSYGGWSVQVLHPHKLIWR